MTQELATETNRIQVTKETIKQYICPAANDQELAMFSQMCIVHELDPFVGDAYLVKYGSKAAQMIVSEQTYNRKMHAIPGYAGCEDGIIIQKENGSIEDRVGEFHLDNEKLVGGWAKIHIKGKEPVLARVRLDDYDKKQSTWNDLKARLINKIARINAVRKAAPEMGGLYVKEELEGLYGKGKAVSQKAKDALPQKTLEEYKQEIDKAKDIDELKSVGAKAREEGFLTDDQFNDLKVYATTANKELSKVIDVEATTPEGNKRDDKKLFEEAKEAIK